MTKPPHAGHYALHPQLAEDTHPLAQLDLCELRLMDDANYPWLVLVPRIANAVELLDLDASQRHRLSDEIDAVGRVLRDSFRPDKLNVAALGNQVPQLHVHVIARFHADPTWPRPVWGTAAARRYSEELLIERVTLLQAALAG